MFMQLCVATLKFLACLILAGSMVLFLVFFTQAVSPDNVKPLIDLLLPRPTYGYLCLIALFQGALSWATLMGFAYGIELLAAIHSDLTD